MRRWTSASDNVHGEQKAHGYPSLDEIVARPNPSMEIIRSTAESHAVFDVQDLQDRSEPDVGEKRIPIFKTARTPSKGSV